MQPVRSVEYKAPGTRSTTSCWPGKTGRGCAHGCAGCTSSNELVRELSQPRIRLAPVATVRLGTYRYDLLRLRPAGMNPAIHIRRLTKSEKSWAQAAECVSRPGPWPELGKLGHVAANARCAVAHLCLHSHVYCGVGTPPRKNDSQRATWSSFGVCWPSVAPNSAMLHHQYVLHS
jgi:hypothetical protein